MPNYFYPNNFNLFYTQLPQVFIFYLIKKYTKWIIDILLPHESILILYSVIRALKYQNDQYF